MTPLGTRLKSRSWFRNRAAHEFPPRPLLAANGTLPSPAPPRPAIPPPGADRSRAQAAPCPGPSPALLSLVRLEAATARHARNARRKDSSVRLRRNTAAKDDRIAAIRRADKIHDDAVTRQRVLLRDGALTSAGYCSACWGIIHERTAAARAIDAAHPETHEIRLNCGEVLAKE